jgi:hypothetical protein
MAAPGARMPRTQIHGSSVMMADRICERFTARFSRRRDNAFSAADRVISRRSG